VASWDVGLSLEKERDLAASYPDLSRGEIAMRALDRYRPLLARFGAEVFLSAGDWTMKYSYLDEAQEFPYVDVPKARQAEFRDRVVKLMLQDVTTGAASDAPAPVSLPSKPPLSNEKQLKTYTYGSLQKAVNGFVRDDVNADVARAARLSAPDVRRARLMWKVSLLRLNAAGKLVVDERVARKGSQYALRYLSDDGARWLDPNEEFKGR
jgi:hypothetical protein